MSDRVAGDETSVLVASDGAAVAIPERLQNRVAIVTGGGHGLGRAYATRLASEGAHVVIAELDRDAGESVAAELRERGLTASAYGTDITDAAALETMVSSVVEAHGRIDILVNNAAMFSRVPMSRSLFDAIEPDEWDRMMSVNLKGTWLACRAVVPEMRKRGYGKIINISSGTAFKGMTTRIHYVTSKAGILGYTKVLARELGADGITVNCVAPGSTLSEEAPDAATLAFRKDATGDRAIPRVQVADDLVGAVAFFASADSDFITGQTLVVDGGSYMH
ncbi:3-oxoacyl-ACP reductase FabG [Microbacterium pseudoresistens]|uniref:3-oxoacyl-[acyl-carrier protein] reductase n=1 Tax=Microbacterium pseudoresistens TaxID=640634 RepID=A0A7Y9EXI2_9MICO|nr:SDR family NAD(P)-dependent oxidoreductase [Microbacterium pseudoresistens]NYD54875.1 3-oxoacyl-[acyl-carrier protein] reductase [Microbacterium pseudoresistens]